MVRRKTGKAADFGSLREPSAEFEDFGGLLSTFVSSEVPGGLPPGHRGITYEAMRNVGATGVPAIMIGTRVDQVAEFAQPSDGAEQGFRIVPIEGAKKDGGLTAAEAKRAAEIQRMVLAVGADEWSRAFTTFEAATRGVIRDSLTIDQATWEVLEGEDGGGKEGLHHIGMAPVDGATIRRVRPARMPKMPTGWAATTMPYDSDVAYVQTVRGRVLATFDRERLAFGIRRPRTDLEANGYGYPEIVAIWQVLMDLANAQTYNSVAFTNGVHTSTILAIQSAMNPAMFKATRRQILAGLSGVRNAQKLPMVLLNPHNKESLSAVNLSSSNRDMEFMQYFALLVKLSAAEFRMDAAEFGFVYGAEGQTAALNQGGPEQRIIASKERGLRPLLRAYQAWLNRWFVSKIDPAYRLEFVGIGTLSEKELMAMLAQAVTKFMTINEARGRLGLERLDTPAGDLILDPTLMNSELARSQAEQPGEDADALGGAFDDGGDGADDDAFGGAFGDGGKDTAGDAEDKGRTFDDVTRDLAKRVDKAREEGRVVWPSVHRSRDRLAYGVTRDASGKPRSVVVRFG